MFAAREVVLTGAIAGVLAAAVLAIWRRARAQGRFAVAGVATLAG